MKLKTELKNILLKPTSLTVKYFFFFFVKNNLCLTSFPKFKKTKFELMTKELEEEVIS